MKKMNFNIQMFGEDGSFVPTAYNEMLETYDSLVPMVNQAFTASQDAMQVFKNVAGSPKLSGATRGFISGLNTSIAETVSYFDSVKGWTVGVSATVKEVLGITLSTASSTVDKTVLETVNENYDNGRVGISTFASAETNITSMQEAVSVLRNALQRITKCVKEAKDSLPNAVAAALTSRISTNNDSVLEGYNKLTQYLTTDIEEFKTQLQSAIDDMASAANSAQ